MKKLQNIWSQVPPDYFSKGVKQNYLQRFWHSRKLQAVAELIGKQSVKTLVDVGSADGSFVSRLCENDVSCQTVIAIDPYFPPLLYGKNLYQRVEYIQANAHHLPIASDTVDVVTICETLEHVVDPYCTLRELRRVLKKTGMVIVELDSGTLFFQAVWFFWKKFGVGKVWNNAHLTFFNVHLLEQLFTNTGLAISKKSFFNSGMGVCYRLKKRPYDKDASR